MSSQPIDHQTSQSLSGQGHSILAKAYLLLGLSFIPCAMGAVVGSAINPMALLGGGWIGIVAFFVFFYGMVFLIEKNRYSHVGTALLQVFTFAMGMMLGPILGMLLGSAAGTQIVFMAAIMTTVVFLSMTVAAHKLKVDNSALGRFLMVGVVVLMTAVIANLFLKIPVLALTISALFVIFSALIIMWQTKHMIDGGETSYISAALTIFIAIYNIFSSLLHLLLAFTGND